MNRQAFRDALLAALPAELVLEDEPMSAHTTFEVGGPVDFFIEATSVTDIQVAIEDARAADVSWRVLGCGSNVLVADDGLRGMVIHIGERLSDITVEGNRIIAQAGATNAEVARIACEAGLSGYEFASGIPGSVGGAAIMDAGAYDGEFRDVAESVLCLTPEGVVRKVTAEEADWGYRHSMMMDAGFIVLEATLALTPDDPAAIQARMDDLKKRREEKQPLELPSAGSTFKRPEGHFAGKLIQDAGMRGHRVGGAMVSEKHAGFVVNAGGATADDICTVITDVQEAVLANSGVRLEPEVRRWGF